MDLVGMNPEHAHQPGDRPVILEDHQRHPCNRPYGTADLTEYPKKIFSGIVNSYIVRTAEILIKW